MCCLGAEKTQEKIRQRWKRKEKKKIERESESGVNEGGGCHVLYHQNPFARLERKRIGFAFYERRKCYRTFTCRRNANVATRVTNDDW